MSITGADGLGKPRASGDDPADEPADEPEEE